MGENEPAWSSKVVGDTGSYTDGAEGEDPYLQGKGGRMPNNDLKLMQGLSVKSLKHHVALQPLFVIMTAGIIFVGAYCGRLAFKGHDVNFSKKKDPVEPMSTLENKQFKMFNVSGFDYSNASARHIEANKYRD